MPATATHSTLPALLLHQLSYLIDELEAQKAVLPRLPAWALEERPLPEAWSIKEMYGVLAATDTTVHLPALRRIVTEPTPRLEPPDREALRTLEDWNALDIETLLERLQAGRRALVAFLSDLPPDAWERTAHYDGAQRDLQAYVHEIILQDTDCLRAVGYRLHESHLTARPQDLPK